MLHKQLRARRINLLVLMTLQSSIFFLLLSFGFFLFVRGGHLVIRIIRFWFLRSLPFLSHGAEQATHGI
jgi:hypothetical protein